MEVPMDTKLTVKLDDEVIKHAKRYAQKNNRSLSKLIEEYFRKLAHPLPAEEVEITPLVRKLRGAFKTRKTIEPSKAYTEYLTKKYLR